MLAHFWLEAEPMTRRRQAAHHRGYTLAELMAVVIIVGILATLATVGVRRYIFAAKSSEAIHMIGSIKAAEEAFKDETFIYLNVSTNLKTYYPTQTPNGKEKVQWGGSGNDSANWIQLGVSAGAPVQYGYACVAGKAGDAVPDPDFKTNPYSSITATTEPFYVVKAVGDMDNDGLQAKFTSSSFSTEIFSENESE